jgi:hypothetical protein
MRCGKGLLGLLVLGSVPSVAVAQASVTSLLDDGDTIIGLGALDAIDTVSINENRMWTAVVDSDFADGTQDGAVLRNGFVTLREGMSLFAPENSILDEWNSVWLTNNGDLGMVLKYKQGTTSNLFGAFWNLLPVAVTDQVFSANFVGDNAKWKTFGFAKLDDANRLYVMGEIDDPDIGASGSKEDSLVRYDLDSSGNILGITVLWTESMFVDALGVSVNDLGQTSEHLLGINDRGDYITYVGSISALGVNALMLNADTVIAQDGQPCPVSGRTWRTGAMAQAKVWINNRGDIVYSGGLTLLNPDTDDNYLIVKNQEKFAQAGDIIPTLSPTGALAQGSAPPIYVDDNGHVFWRAETRGTNEDAFLRDYIPIVQQNRTVIDGKLVVEVGVSANAFAVSQTGRFWVGRADLQSASNTSLLYADFGLVLEMPGCYGNPGKLGHVSGEALVDDHLEFSMDDGQAPGVFPSIILSTRQRIPGSDCGILTPRGEVMIASAFKVGTIFLPVWDGTQPSTKDEPIPNNISLVDLKLFAQGVFRDTTPGAPEPFRLTNALRIEIGPPGP